jgi:hypothetical protein
MAKTSHGKDFDSIRDGEVGWFQVYRELIPEWAWSLSAGLGWGCTQT